MIADGSLIMIHNHLFIEILLREQQKEILKSAELHRQMKDYKTDLRKDKSSRHIFQDIKSRFARKKIEVRPAMVISDRSPTSDCQVC